MRTVHERHTLPITVLALEHVTGGYGGAEIIHEVSLGVCPGEIVVLIGPNGAGKSTVMNAVLGRLTLSGGRVTLQGRDITDTAPDRVVRQGVSYVPQTANVFPNSPWPRTLRWEPTSAGTISVRACRKCTNSFRPLQSAAARRPGISRETAPDGRDRQGAHGGTGRSSPR